MTLRNRTIRLAYENPDLRPWILPLLKTAEDRVWREKLKKYDQKAGYYLHFSDIPKASIPPNSVYSPFGFYTYPSDLDKVAYFGKERPYILVMGPGSSRILNLREYSQSDYERDYSKLLQAFSVKALREAEKKVRSKLPGHYGEKIWKLTNELANKDARKWSNLFVSILGYDAVEDDCEGVIHMGEDCQAVFFDPDKMQLVEVIEKTPGETELREILRDFSHKDLSGQTLTMSVRDLDFTGANLTAASFERSKIHNANFAGANLTRAKFIALVSEYANFTGANLTGFQASGGTKIEYAQMMGANLTGSSFEGVNLSGADLTGATLRNVRFIDSEFIISKFNGTALTNVDFKGSTIHGTDFSGCKLQGVDFSEAIFKKPNFAKAKYDPSTKFPAGFDVAKAKLKPL